MEQRKHLCKMRYFCNFAKFWRLKRSAKFGSVQHKIKENWQGFLVAHLFYHIFCPQKKKRCTISKYIGFMYCRAKCQSPGRLKRKLTVFLHFEHNNSAIMNQIQAILVWKLWKHIPLQRGFSHSLHQKELLLFLHSAHSIWRFDNFEPGLRGIFARKERWPSAEVNLVPTCMSFNFLRWNLASVVDRIFFSRKSSIIFASAAHVLPFCSEGQCNTFTESEKSVLHREVP